jgi:hypothetical protein
VFDAAGRVRDKLLHLLRVVSVSSGLLTLPSPASTSLEQDFPVSMRDASGRTEQLLLFIRQILNE